MTTGPAANFPDTREGLSEMLQACDAGFGLYKDYHWGAQIRDVIGPWLDTHDENVRTVHLTELEGRGLLRPEPWPPIPYPDDAVHQARWTIQRAFDDAHGNSSNRNEALIAAAESLVAEGWLPPAPDARRQLTEAVSRGVFYKGWMHDLRQILGIAARPDAPRTS